MPPIAVRPSTDVSGAVADPLVARALRFIRARACDNLRVEDVLAHVEGSRSVLQRRFRRATGRTVHGAIAEARVDLAKRLLVETGLPLPEVARRSGFSHAEYLGVVFRRAVGSTPGAYRREHGRAAAAPVESAPAGCA